MYICQVAPGRGSTPLLAEAIAGLVFRFALRPYFALLLLLCLGRTLLPEAWVLALHPHSHTIREAACTGRRPRCQLLFTARHQHCHTEQFYNAPYAAGSIVQLPNLRQRLGYAPRYAARVRAVPRWARLVRGQRGPPVAGC